MSPGLSHDARPVVLVLCPMEIERAAVARAVRRAGLDASVTTQRTGIGKEAIIRRIGALGDPLPRLVILAGACGALRPVEDVPPIARIIDEFGGEWTGGIGMTPTGRTLLAVDRIVERPADKRALADATGAAVVDMESHAFAAACEERGLAWAVVRGVSDSPEESLPREVLGWIAPDGTTRAGRAVLDMARHPGLVLHMAAVMRRSRRVLPAVGRRVAELARTMLERGVTMGA